MALKTPEVNGARQDLPCLDSPEVNGARQEVAAVEKCVDGAWQEVWRRETYIIENGRTVNGYSLDANTSGTYGWYISGGSEYLYMGYSVYCGVSSHSGGGTAVFVPGVDLSKHSKVYIEMDYDEMEPYSGSQVIESSQEVFLSDTENRSQPGTVLASAYYAGKSENGRPLYCIDIPELSGEGYIKVQVSYTYEDAGYSVVREHTIRMYNMWAK